MGKEKEDLDSSRNSHSSTYWQAVKDDFTNFDAWVSLLQHVEQKDDIRKIREAFDSFLTRFPYCYGYWKKYAELEKQHKHPDKCKDVYLRGVQAIPLSVELWMCFLEFYQDYIAGEKSSEDKVRGMFTKAVDAAGLDFRSDKLWEAFLNWELKLCHLKNVFGLYDRLLKIPTLMYSNHYERFQQLVNRHSPDDILSENEYYELFQEIEASLKKKGQEIYIGEGPYARYMEGFDKHGSREVYQRACYTHLPKKPNLRLALAAFEERQD